MSANAQRWSGAPGFYEVWYISLTDPASGTGVWIRYTMLAPRTGAATCSLWLLAMEPDGPPTARKADWPIAELRVQPAPFDLTLAGATLSDSGAEGAFEDVAWSLAWRPGEEALAMVHPLAAPLARTQYVVSHPDLAIDGELTLPGGRSLSLRGARGGQSHVWGTKHAERWAWLHCNDLGEDGAVLESVSVIVPRLGRDVGPYTALQARLGGERIEAIAPARALLHASRFGLTGWTLDSRAGARRVLVEVDAPRESLAGVTYHDPDGEPAHCYNTERASARVQLLRRRRGYPPWAHAGRWQADGCAHFEYGQREPLPGVPLLVR